MGKIPLPAALDGIIETRPITLDRALFYLVTGVLDKLVLFEQFQQTGTLTPEATIDAINAMLWTYLTEDCTAVENYPTIQHHDPGETIIVNGNGMGFESGGTYATQFNATIIFQDPPANGDIFEMPLLLNAGDWELQIICVKRSNAGRVTWKVDGTTVETNQDFYNASTLLNEFLIVNFTVTTDGLHTLRGEVSKRAASSGYLIPISAMYFFKTG